ncbi:hypothetical protein HAX54_040288 [Datura stramonium]|uniref:Uncharacterized protein n=1 Tax=Datura stramonium TaxID=4076 RepID=A0ABS8SJW1_DATST|nr:hypothetical protein [Datura stramonium]
MYFSGWSLKALNAVQSSGMEAQVAERWDAEVARCIALMTHPQESEGRLTKETNVVPQLQNAKRRDCPSDEVLST